MKMKIEEVIKDRTNTYDFPVLLECVTGEVVLAVQYNSDDKECFEGTCLKGGEFYKTGFFSKNWRLSVCSKYNDKIILEND